MRKSHKCSERQQINIRIEVELFDFLVEYSRENYKTVTGVVREIIADLYKAHKDRIVVDENGVSIISKK